MKNVLCKHLASNSKRTSLYGAFFLYFLIVSIGSVPGTRQELGDIASKFIPVEQIDSKYILHTVAYGLIELLLFIGYIGPVTKKAVQALLTVVAMGALDECIQSVLPYRTGAVLDWIIDIVAGLVVLFLLFVIGHIKNRSLLSKFIGFNIYK